MAYEKTLWKTGDVVTEEKMNKIEQGIKSMELPTITASDNGKALVVENGTWALGNASGGSGGAKNMVDGSADGSVRTVESTEENENYTIGFCAFSSGASTKAGGMFSHAEGSNTNASGSSSHAEGSFTTASGNYSHAEGYETTASEEYSHAEGYETTASGNSSHAEGYNTTASGGYSHAEGSETTARGGYSHAEGFNTIAYSSYQHVQGQFNIQDENGDYAFIIGNGTNAGARSNALGIKWDGTFVFANGTEISPAQFTNLLALLNSEE